MGNGTGKERDPVVAELMDKVAAEGEALKRLDLRSKNLTSLPPEIALLTNLTWLNLPNNLLTELPEHLCELTSLQTLRLLGNRLGHLPPQITALQALSTLDISKNDFLSIDDSIGALTALADLNLHWNLVEEVRPRHFAPLFVCQSSPPHTEKLYYVTIALSLDLKLSVGGRKKSTPAVASTVTHPVRFPPR